MLKNILAMIAAAGLAVTPVAVQANTRATDAGVTVGAAAFGGGALFGNPEDECLDEDGDDACMPLEIIFAVFAGAAVAIIALIESNGGVIVDPPASAGT